MKPRDLLIDLPAVGLDSAVREMVDNHVHHQAQSASDRCARFASFIYDHTTEIGAEINPFFEDGHEICLQRCKIAFSKAEKKTFYDGSEAERRPP